MEENLPKTEGKKKLFKDKKNIAIIILSALLIMSLGDSSNTSTETSSNITSVLTEKEQQIQENQNIIENLQNENKILYEEKQNLENENSQLQAEKDDIESEKNRLEQENQTLNTEIQQLKKTSSTKSSTLNTEISTQKSQTTETTENTNSTIVYITETGNKYHKSNCSYLKKSKIEITLSNAKAQGYTPCSRCY